MNIQEPDTSNPPRILVVGDVMLDHYVWGDCTRISPEAPVQVVHVVRETHSLGGAANVAANLAALGAAPVLLGVVGMDAERERFTNALAARGLDTGTIITAPQRATTVKRRVIAGAQQIVRIDYESSDLLTTELEQQLLDSFVEHVRSAAICVLSDYAKGVLSERVTQAIIRESRARRVPVVVDPKGSDYRKYHGATIVTPNRKEAALALGRALPSLDAALAAGRDLRDRHGLDACLITLSEDGMALVEAEREILLATEAREVFDVTGAGDTVVAALSVAMATGADLVDACRFANAAAGLVVSKIGSATTTFAEIRRSLTHSSAGGSKWLARGELMARVRELRASGKRIVFTNGCFDVLHAGHVRYLTQAAALGDALVVAINDDASVSRLKGATRPVNELMDRAQVLAALMPVTFVTPFSEDTPQVLIDLVAPDVLVKGGDYVAEEVVGAASVRARGGRVAILPFLEGRSTTRTLARLAGHSAE